MERIKLHDKYFKPFIPNEKIEEAIIKVANSLNKAYTDREAPLFLSVLNGSFMFTASLLKAIDFTCELSFVKLASYEGSCSSGKVKQLIGLGQCVEGRSIIIVEDIVDTGKTIIELNQLLKDAGAKDIKVCTLFYKPNAYKGSIPIDYASMEIGNEFIVGYGLDYDGLGRQYKDIYIID